VLSWLCLDRLELGPRLSESLSEIAKSSVGTKYRNRSWGIDVYFRHVPVERFDIWGLRFGRLGEGPCFGNVERGKCFEKVESVLEYFG
jgi:hypothetical protein